MTIEEATKLQQELLTLLPEVGFNKYMASTRLGIEAMKRLKRNREDPVLAIFTPLPGETKEVKGGDDYGKATISHKETPYHANRRGTPSTCG